MSSLPQILVASIAGLHLLAGAAACSSESAAPGATANKSAGEGGADAAPTTEPTDATALPEPSCAPPPSASKCKNDGAWVRGVAHFDPAHFAAGAKPTLRVTLRHAFALLDGEEKIGGRLHAFKSIPIKDTSSGQVEFAIDMCMFGTSMWSEENDPFNLVLHIDENDNNNLSSARTNADAIVRGTPDRGELVKMVTVDVSCHAPSRCVDVTLGCADGETCTTITPIASCTKKAPGCGSDDAFCQ